MLIYTKVRVEPSPYRRHCTAAKWHWSHENRIKKRVLQLARMNLIIRLYLEDGMTWKKIGEQVGVSTARAQQIGLSGLQRLRAAKATGDNIDISVAEKRKKYFS